MNVVSLILSCSPLKKKGSTEVFANKLMYLNTWPRATFDSNIPPFKKVASDCSINLQLQMSGFLHGFCHGSVSLQATTTQQTASPLGFGTGEERCARQMAEDLVYREGG